VPLRTFTRGWPPHHLLMLQVRQREEGSDRAILLVGNDRRTDVGKGRGRGTVRQGGGLLRVLVHAAGVRAGRRAEELPLSPELDGVEDAAGLRKEADSLRGKGGAGGVLVERPQSWRRGGGTYILRRGPEGGMAEEDTHMGRTREGAWRGILPGFRGARHSPPIRAAYEY